ncbi:MAG: MBL fold metallo-hydrolase [Bacteroidetes bacterium QS_8_68_28]|nr:MAG: MBL fold metallo-hydrolase [Bacteroidetes bacterium QS_8_68_28]
MPTLHLLGTGAAMSAPPRTTTMLAFAARSGNAAGEDGSSALLVDCGGDALQRYRQAGLDSDALDAVILTHEHPDHVGGFPLLMERLWLGGRERPLPVCGIAQALTQAERLFDAFDTSGWDGMPEIRWREVPYEEGAPVFENDAWRVTAAPVEHAKPTVGLRAEHSPSGRVAAYSCDTAPTPSVARLAEGADVLVHEATGDMDGHSSAEQAAEVAAEAGAGRLLLVHLPPDLTDADLSAARSRFERTEAGEERGRYPF